MPTLVRSVRVNISRQPPVVSILARVARNSTTQFPIWRSTAKRVRTLVTVQNLAYICGSVGVSVNL